MIQCVGWKRLEANRMFKFQDVSKKDFNAVLRRSLVWRVKARFEDPDAIEGLKIMRGDAQPVFVAIYFA